MHTALPGAEDSRHRPHAGGLEGTDSQACCSWKVLTHRHAAPVKQTLPGAAVSQCPSIDHTLAAQMTHRRAAPSCRHCLVQELPCIARTPVAWGLPLTQTYCSPHAGT